MRWSYGTQDLELDVKRTFAVADELVDRLRDGLWWWDEKWAAWEADPSWGLVALPDGWEQV